MGKEAIETIEAKTAEELIVRLSPGQKEWTGTGGLTCWVFRGQADSRWGLTPAAMRPEKLMHYGIGVATPLVFTTEEERRAAEQEAVLGFAGECVGCGLALPEDGQWLRDPTMAALAFREQLSMPINYGVNFPFPPLPPPYPL